jgi:hypothetical protein
MAVLSAKHLIEIESLTPFVKVNKKQEYFWQYVTINLG